jgi:hypothetical protein
MSSDDDQDQMHSEELQETKSPEAPQNISPEGLEEVDISKPVKPPKDIEEGKKKSEEFEEKSKNTSL